MAIVSKENSQNARFIFSIGIIPENSRIIHLGKSANILEDALSQENINFELQNILAENESDIIECVKKLVKFAKQNNIIKPEEHGLVSTNRLNKIIED